MSTPDFDKTQGEQDGMFDFLEEEAANNPARKKSKRSRKQLVMPIIREPVPISESGPARLTPLVGDGISDSSQNSASDQDASSIAERATISSPTITSKGNESNADNDFAFLNGRVSEPRQASSSEFDSDWNEGIHQDYDDDIRSGGNKWLLPLLGVGVIGLGALAYIWYNQQAAGVSSEVPVSASTNNDNDNLIADTANDAQATAVLSTDTRSLFQRFDEQLKLLEGLIADGKLNEAEQVIGSMDRSVYGYGAPEFGELETRIAGLKAGLIDPFTDDETVAEATRNAALEQQAEEQRQAEIALAAEQEKQAAEAARVLEEQRQAELALAAEQEKQAAEAARLVEEQRQAELARVAEQQRQAAEVARLAEEQRQAELARVAEQERQAAEAARLAEEQRQAELARAAEQEKQAAEAARLAEEQRQAELARTAEQERQAAEAARLAEEQRQAELARVAEQERQAELERAQQQEAARLLEQQRQAEADRLAAIELAAQQREAEQLQQQEAQRQAEADRAAAEALVIAQRQAAESERIQAAQRAAAQRRAEQASTAAALAAEQVRQAELAAAAERSLALATAKAEERRAQELLAEQAETQRRIAERNRLSNERARAAEFARNQAANREAQQAQEQLIIVPKPNTISDADFDYVTEQFHGLKTAIEQRDIARVIALTDRSGSRIQQMLQLFENNAAVKARVVNTSSRVADGVVVGTLKIEKLTKASGAVVNAPSNLSSIPISSKRGPAGWSAIQW